MKVLRYSTLETPFGTLWFAASPKGLSFLLLRFFGQRRTPQQLRKARGAKLVRDDKALRDFAAQLTRYLEGEKLSFDVELDLS
ncbi:MAG: methylated-DNA--[protein]-cysteine S-methyltransferase [Candidatus Eiseniibacteriota bacterium]|nr:MAG: methylated-DNA--[protein]-cysteine S-methyltransferase [Candidatus Eisenbacteria bacterium]